MEHVDQQGFLADGGDPVLAVETTAGALDEAKHCATHADPAQALRHAGQRRVVQALQLIPGPLAVQQPDFGNWILDPIALPQPSLLGLVAPEHEREADHEQREKKAPLCPGDFFFLVRFLPRPAVHASKEGSETHEGEPGKQGEEGLHTAIHVAIEKSAHRQPQPVGHAVGPQVGRDERDVDGQSKGHEGKNPRLSDGPRQALQNEQ